MKSSRGKIHSVAQKIDRKAKVACATFKAICDKERPCASMTVEGAFLFAGGTQLFNLIRGRVPQTSRNLINKLDKVFSVTELAAIAKVYRDKRTPATCCILSRILNGSKTKSRIGRKISRIKTRREKKSQGINLREISRF